MKLADLPRTRLAHLPTPIEELANLSRELGGPRLFVKRDDCTGLATGGNKTRKLEYLLGDALAAGADTLLTEGGLQSNHCRQTVAAARRCGLECILVLEEGYAKEVTGNLLLDQILGARIVTTPPGADRAAVMRELAAELEAKGGRPYLIPTGGSNGIGAMGYANFMFELAEQSSALGVEFDAIVTASGSGGTQGGLLLGKRLMGTATRIVGISDGEPRGELVEMVLAVARDGAALLGEAFEFRDDELEIHDQYYGEGYGIPTPEMVETVRRVARCEGLLLDPVYNGKAMAGLLDLVARGAFAADARVLFVHTGGTPALFAYREVFAQ